MLVTGAWRAITWATLCWTFVVSQTGIHTKVQSERQNSTYCWHQQKKKKKKKEM